MATEVQVLTAIRQNECTTKKAALEKIKKKLNKYVSMYKEDNSQLKSYFSLMIKYLTLLYAKVGMAEIFDVLPDYWVYSFDYQYDEFALRVEHICKYELDEKLEYKSCTLNASYKLIEVKPTAFTVDAYAKFYEVEQGTVRQWIRRGKIRTAYKEGSEWKIPELSPPVIRGYEGAQFKWLDGIDNLPEEYAYLSDYVIATFYQDRVERAKYHVLLVSKETFFSDNPEAMASIRNKELLLSAKEREKLELFMIAHPQIKYCGHLI